MKIMNPKMAGATMRLRYDRDEDGVGRSVTGDERGVFDVPKRDGEMLVQTPGWSSYPPKKAAKPVAPPPPPPAPEPEETPESPEKPEEVPEVEEPEEAAEEAAEGDDAEEGDEVPDFGSMTIAQLKEAAASFNEQGYEIELTSDMRKADMVEAIESAVLVSDED